jgi:predicted nucleotidyltransferase
MESAGSILFSKTRQAVLTALFTVVDERAHLRELARRTGIRPGPLQHELSLLVSADLVTRVKDGNRVVYQANGSHPAFQELRGLVLKTCGFQEQLRTALSTFGEQISLALIFGSVAKGASHGKSDVDLLVVGTTPLDAILAAIEPIEHQLGREISVRLFEVSEYKYRRDSRDRFLTTIISGPTIPIIGNPHDVT